MQLVLESEQTELLRRYARPLGVAFAAFVKELERPGDTPGSGTAGEPRPVEPVELNSNLALEVAGIHLRRVALSKGFTQKALAHRLRVNPSVVSRIFKRPERSNLQTMRRIAKALGVSVQDILPKG